MAKIIFFSAETIFFATKKHEFYIFSILFGKINIFMWWTNLKVHPLLREMWIFIDVFPAIKGNDFVNFLSERRAVSESRFRVMDKLGNPNYLGEQKFLADLAIPPPSVYFGKSFLVFLRF